MISTTISAGPRALALSPYIVSKGCEKCFVCIGSFSLTITYFLLHNICLYFAARNVTLVFFFEFA